MEGKVAEHLRAHGSRFHFQTCPPPYQGHYDSDECTNLSEGARTALCITTDVGHCCSELIGRWLQRRKPSISVAPNCKKVLLLQIAKVALLPESFLAPY